MTTIFIEDSAIAQILTSAIEAYEISHRRTKDDTSQKLETFGLLWGYHTQANQSVDSDKITAVMATVETSAKRHNEWVEPNFESLSMKKDFIEKYWGNLSLVGTFHSHPYENRGEIRKNKGWRASGMISESEDGDAEYFPVLHEQIASEKIKLAHIIVTLTLLQREGTASTQRLKNEGESRKGYRITAGKRKLWLRAYGTERVEPSNDSNKKCEFTDTSILEIPSLIARFNDL